MKKDSKMTEEQRRKNRETQKIVWANPKLRKRHSEIHKGQHSSPKTEFKKGDIRLIGNKINVGRTPYNKGLTIENGGLNIPLEKRKKRSEAIQKRWENSDYRKKRSEETKKLWQNEKYREKLVEIHKELNSKTAFKKGHKFSEEIINKIRESTLKQYESGSFPKSSNTKPERQIKEELVKRGYKEEIDFIHQYKKDMHIFDFCFPKQKVMIEVDGDFWHANPKIFPDQAKLHPHQIKGINRDKAKSAYISKVDDGSWTLIRIWERDINKDFAECLNKIEEALAEKKNI